MTTYVLIPGGGGNAQYWQFVVPLLREHGHQAVAVQLPNDPGVGLPEHADAIVAAASAADEIVVVAQSMGGFAAPLVCDRLPVSMLVLVNAMIGQPGETPGAWWDNTGQPAAKRANDVREGRDPDAEFDPVTMFFHDVPQSVREIVFAGPDEPPADSIFASPLNIESWPDVPTRVVSGRDDRLFPLEFQRRVAHDRLGIAPDVLPGGHLIAFSHPAELAAQLLAYRAD